MKFKKLVKTTCLAASILQLSSVQAVDGAKARVNDLEEKVMELELNGLISRVSFSGSLRQQTDYINVHRGRKEPKWTRIILGNKFRLNMHAPISRNVDVYTGLSAAYYFGDELGNGAKPSYDTANEYDGATLRISKAYFDWRIHDAFVFSAGRLPTIDGPPAHIIDGLAQQGTYPIIGYSVPLDGLALNVHFNKVFKFRDKLILRLVYYPLTSVKRETGFTPGTRGTLDHYRKELSHNTDGLTAQLDYSTNRMSLAEKVSVILQGYYIGFGALQGISAQGLLDSVFAGDKAIYEIQSTRKKLTDATIIVAHLELEKILKTNLSFYFSFKKIWLRSAGRLNATVTQADSLNPIYALANPAGTVYDLGGFLTNGRDRGERYLAGLNYAFTSKLRLGGEYLFARPHSAGFSHYSDSITNFYNTLGRGGHIYLSNQFVENRFILRAGYTNVLETSSFVGFLVADSRRRIQNVYTTLKFYF